MHLLGSRRQVTISFVNVGMSSENPPDQTTIQHYQEHQHALVLKNKILMAVLNRSELPKNRTIILYHLVYKEYNLFQKQFPVLLLAYFEHPPSNH